MGKYTSWWIMEKHIRFLQDTAGNLSRHDSDSTILPTQVANHSAGLVIEDSTFSSLQYLNGTNNYARSIRPQVTFKPQPINFGYMDCTH